MNRLGGFILHGLAFKSLLFVLCFLSHSLLLAQTCNHQALRENFNTELEKGIIKYTYKNDQYLGPVRDQDSTGYCYAYAGADLYEHWLKKKGLMDKGEQVSGVAMGIMTQKRNWRDLMSDVSGQQFMDQEKVKKLEELNRSLKVLDDLYDKTFKEMLGTTSDERRDVLLKKWQEITGKQAPLMREKIKLRNSFSQGTPGGGSARMVIEKGMKKLCFESEISSQGVDRLRRENTSKDSIDVRPWDVFESINDALIYLNLDKLSNEAEFDKENCQYLKVVNALFPGIFFKNVSELKAFLEKLGESNVEEFFQASCSDKKIPKKPKIKEEFELSNYILKKKNKKIEAMIDGALKKGDVAVAYYHGNLLAGDKFAGLSLDAHASVITGSIDICGKNYYVLRNSWGKESCKAYQIEFEYQLSKNETYKNSTTKRQTCQIKAAQELARGKMVCKEQDMLCLNKFVDLYSTAMDQCRDVFALETKDIPPSSLYCNAEGDFIIAKDHFLKGSFGAVTIEN